MSWKEKLFTLINTRFYTKEEVDSKATVVFIRHSSDFTLRYNGKDFNSERIRTGFDDDNKHSIHSSILVMELPVGNYDFEATSDTKANITQVGTGAWEFNQKLIFVNYFDCIGEPEVTTQQEI